MPSLICVLALIVGQAPAPVKNEAVTIRVKVPAGTPPGARVFLAGSLPSLNDWEPNGREMTRLDDGRYAIVVLVPRGKSLFYKFTLGAWNRVEMAGEGKNQPNREVKADRDGPIEVEDTIVAWAPQALTCTVTGVLKIHAGFASKALGNQRTIRVWLPPGYVMNADDRYPVVYFQDGQNLFDDSTSFAGEWRADETADRLIRAKKLPPMILVAIDNTGDRIDEYTPVKDERPHVEKKHGGKLLLYARFVVEELKPFIDKTYRTKPGPESTAVVGASLGGLAAMEMTLEYPGTFGLCAAVSPSIWWANDRLIADVKARAKEARRCRFWIDMGTREGAKKDEKVSEAVDRLMKLAGALEGDGLKPDRDFHSEVIQGGEHNEAAWSARLGDVLTFLFVK